MILGCASSKLFDHARRGEHGALKGELLRHPVSNQKARQLARETLSFEVKHAKDRVDRPFIRSLETCAGSVSDALAERARIKDGVGAEAAMLLVDLKKLPDVERFADEEDGAWRALSARRSSGTTRLSYFSDPDERVRLAALRAAEESPEPEEIAQLLEVVRLDPSSEVKLRAVRALAQFDSASVVDALRDRYSGLDEVLRVAVVEAWGKAPLLEHGGRQQLQYIMGQRASLETVVAASTLSLDARPEVYNPALTRLERLMSEGTLAEQRLALILMPLHHATTTRLLLDAAATATPELALIAWSRLLAHAQHRSRAEQALLKWAEQKADPQLALQAQSALAAGGSQAIHAVLRSQLSNTEPLRRKWAALGLVRLGALSDASLLVADDSPEVRRAVACRIVSAPKVPVHADH
jgi:HEAT repeat protein